MFPRLLAAFILLLSLVSCNEKSTSELTRAGTLKIIATDAPFNFDLVSAAKITVDKIVVRESSGVKITVMDDDVTLDLLQLRNGVVETLVDVNIPAGNYDQISLYVTNASVDLKDGRHFPLVVPSGAESGLKISVKPAMSVTTGMSTDVLLDFDLSRSFIPRGTLENISGFNFRPVIRAANLSSAGTVAGQVLSVVNDTPVSSGIVSVSQNNIIVATAVTDSDGHFKILGLPEGTYSIKAEASDFGTFTNDSLIVSAGNEVITHFVLTPVEETVE